jgi:hypothetical protein
VALREVTCPTIQQWVVVLKGPSSQLGMEYVCNEGDNAPLFLTVKSCGKAFTCGNTALLAEHALLTD